MLRSEKKPSTTAAAAGGRTARVCDSCACKRARWFCAADDAFLCQSCDVSVHSANQVARRHDRIRLETASYKPKPQPQLPPWPKGFTRKARTPRPSKQMLSSNQKASFFSLVPEIGNDDGLLLEDNEEEQAEFVHLHHQNHQQVPVFDPLTEEENFLLTDELDDFGDGFLPSEVDLAEFVADVENLLETQQLKVKDEEQDHELEGNGVEINGVLGWNFKGEEIEEEEEKENKVVPIVEDEEELLKRNKNKKKKNDIFLKLNYDEVIMAWDAQSSPYTTGNRPEFDLDECWLGWSGAGSLGGRGDWKNDGEREARVSRYREKRRTRLFSKKIRYQVRKLNAEKRPRMKGRFVKRTALPLPLTMSSNSISNHTTFP